MLVARIRIIERTYCRMPSIGRLKRITVNHKIIRMSPVAQHRRKCRRGLYARLQCPNLLFEIERGHKARAYMHESHFKPTYWLPRGGPCGAPPRGGAGGNVPPSARIFIFSRACVNCCVLRALSASRAASSANIELSKTNV